MSAPSDTRPPLVLVVDDDPVLRMIGAEALAAIGFETIEAETGEDALAMVSERVPDLVLLDLRLPGRNGLSICRDMRWQPALADLPILIVTGQTDKDTIDRAFEAGATDFIQKPLDWQLVQHRVRFLMRANSAFKDLKSTLSDLAQSRHELETTREIGRMGSWELDPESGQMIWSDEVHRLIGTLATASASFSWEGFRSLIPKDDWVALRKAVDAARASGRPSTLEHELMDLRGESHVVHEYIEVVEVSPGELRIRGTIQDVTERRRVEAQVEYLETFDSLTRLPNRAFLRDRLERLLPRCRKGGSSLGILCVDLDRFNRVNQALGYATGDDLLRAVSERLLDSVRGTDFVGRGAEPPEISRFGGDEFTVVLTGVVHEGTVRQAASRILNSLAEPFTVGEHSIPLSASIGIALMQDGDIDADTLIGQAGMAMSWAKRDGGGCYRFSDSTASRTAAIQIALESELAAAIQNDELILDYQPQIDAQTGELKALEALVRWNHPQRGRLMPGDFIPTAEACGLVTAMGAWVLRRACRQLVEWDAAGLPPIRVGSNISSLQFQHGRVVEAVREALDEAGLDPSRLELEITETALLGDSEYVGNTCEALRELGVSLALDDFGTGFSSLSHLFRFQIDTLKIDRSFTARIRSDDKACGIISAMIAMAKGLGLSVTAEGVEEPEEESFLREQGCDLLQGFGLCRPAPPEQIEAWIRERNRSRVRI